MTENILELIHEKKWKDVQKEILSIHPVHIVEIIEGLQDQEMLILFRILSKDIAAEVFSYLSSEQQKIIVHSITDKELKGILDALFFDDMIDFLEEMPSNLVKKILKNAQEEERRLINQFLKYPEYSAGSLMTIEFVEFKKDMTVKEAMTSIKNTGVDKETIYTCYVTNAHRKLEGFLSLRKLVTNDLDHTIEEIMDTDVIHVHTHDDQEVIAHLFKKYDFIAIPVVDNEKRLVGIITIDDIVDVIEQESTEDFQRMAAMHPSEFEYLRTSVFSLSRQRFTWLLVLMISATFTGSIIHRFEDMLASVVILATFIPMLMDTGGNAGAQSSTLIIRGLALGEIETKDYLKVMSKELKVSSLVGIVLALVNMLRMVILQQSNLQVILIVNITLFSTVVLAKLIGGLLPLGAQKLKMDPAMMAGPLITTIVDAASLTIYFTLAAWLLGL